MSTDAPLEAATALDAADTAIKKSYRELAPLEEGGRTARDGFDYQDHVAVNKCLDMLLGTGASEVWCEAEDDLVLVHSTGGGECFEFVQVKGVELKQAWSVAKLCERQPGKDGTRKHSILEKSLAHDRGREPCAFRIVTRWGPNDVLEVLLNERSQRTHPVLAAALAAAIKALAASVGSVLSPNGAGIPFWVEQTVWEHRASTADIRNDNIVKLTLLLDRAGASLAPDQTDELHAALYARVQDASLANGLTEARKKRLSCGDLRTWLLDRAQRIQHPTHSGASRPLRQKLTDAGLDASYVRSAEELRRRYLMEARRPRYLSFEDRDALEGEIHACLLDLKTRLDAGDISDNGHQFLRRCHSELKAVRDQVRAGTPDVIVLGCLYEMMNRCLHRLARAR